MKLNCDCFHYVKWSLTEYFKVKGQFYLFNYSSFHLEIPSIQLFNTYKVPTTLTILDYG